MRVVIAEDSVLLREGVTSLLVDRGVEVVGSVDTVDDLLALVRGSVPRRGNRRHPSASDPQ